MLLLVLRRSRFEEGNEQSLKASFPSEFVMQPFFQPVSSLRVFFPSFPLVCHHPESNRTPITTVLTGKLSFSHYSFFFSREKETKQLDCTTTYTNHSLFSEEQEESVGANDKSSRNFQKNINRKNA